MRMEGAVLAQSCVLPKTAIQKVLRLASVSLIVTPNPTKFAQIHGDIIPLLNKLFNYAHILI